MEYSAPSARAKLDMNHPKLWWVMCLCYVQRVAFFGMYAGKIGKGVLQKCAEWENYFLWMCDHSIASF
jgi:hypothetical protein